MACALAYARTGSFAASEEIAQEAFLAAWRQMNVEPPRNFRAWLCGTIRHLAARFHRGAARFEGMSAELVDGGPAPDEIVDAREEEALVWSSLEQLAEIYREPLILYYRQDRSIRDVAATLELSEDAVRQRLSRGRALLRDTVQ
jgi:RNA polymerase sigma factor (sigma-70 family)